METELTRPRNSRSAKLSSLATATREVNVNTIALEPLQQDPRPLMWVRAALAAAAFLAAMFSGISDLHANEEELAAAQGMEAMVISSMLEQMRKTVPESEFVPKSQAERIYENMLDYEYASAMSKTGTFGIAELVLAEIQGKR